MNTLTRPELGFGDIVLGVLPPSVKCWKDDHKLRPMLILDTSGSNAEIVPLSTKCVRGLHLLPNETNHLHKPCELVADTRLEFSDADRLRRIGRLTPGEVIKLRKILGWYPVVWRHAV